MEKQKIKNQSPFEFDEKGTAEVSKQIMDSYNSGCINQWYLQDGVYVSRKDDKKT